MKQQSITSLPLAPEIERHHRMVKYSVAMGIRFLCVIALIFVHGWWLVIPAVGAIFLPYFAVVVANAVVNPGASSVERPGSVGLITPPPRPADGAHR